ncbi:MAG: acyl-CoA dehydratase activase [Archaeoglobaceae archaeon]|nr:acyl-CoA dehydratase activase [Archaeoglobaceae archaeon]MDW8118163.1 acyl-CoA dehydratase activase [Archaeoglobaceae archaeon]
MFLGIDVGTRFTKAVLWDGKLLSHVIEETTGNMNPVLESILAKFRKYGDFERCCATGSGAQLVEFADLREDDVICLAIAGRDIVNADYVIDIGAQSITVISVDKDGNVIDYIKNDKCASGSGKFLEVMSSALGIAFKELDNFALNSDKKLAITSQCAVFAESEVISYVNEGEKRENIISAVCDSIAKIVASQVKKLSINGRYTITGGVANFTSITERIRKNIGGDYVIFPSPQLATAIGAGIVAEEF